MRLCDVLLLIRVDFGERNLVRPRKLRRELLVEWCYSLAWSAPVWNLARTAVEKSGELYQSA